MAISFNVEASDTDKFFSLVSCFEPRQDLIDKDPEQGSTKG
jgi:hypothetical protein